MVTLKILCAMLFAAALFASAVIDTGGVTSGLEPIQISGLIH